MNLWCIKWPQIDGNVFLTGKVYELSLELKAELVSGFKPLRINSFGDSSSGAFAPTLSGTRASGRWVYGPQELEKKFENKAELIPLELETFLLLHCVGDQWSCEPSVQS